MTETSSKKNYQVAIYLGVGLLLVNVLAIIWYFLPGGPDQWRGDVIPGKVQSLSTSTLTTIDQRGEIKQFILTPETKFFAGKLEVDGSLVLPDSLVLVKLNVATDTDFVAQDIRIMSDKRKNKPQPE